MHFEAKKSWLPMYPGSALDDSFDVKVWQTSDATQRSIDGGATIASSTSKAH